MITKNTFDWWFFKDHGIEDNFRMNYSPVYLILIFFAFFIRLNIINNHSYDCYAINDLRKQDSGNG